MDNFKKVSREHLNTFRLMLETTTDKKELVEYFDSYILELEKENVNELKRIIYLLMKQYSSTDKDKSHRYYTLYQGLKNKTIDYKNALKLWKNEF